jgi:RNA polymerase sigma factor (sigma-70 family)
MGQPGFDNESVASTRDGGGPDAELLKRFSAGRDEAAFAALVNRHGPMVQGVCRRILGNAHEAEDVFQAVFLVLVQKSSSIRRPELLANWLYGVACRIARKARIRTIRQEARERKAEKMPLHEQLLDLEWAELKQVLDEELSRLPEKHRAPLVLCYLRGQTNAEAAAQLGWPSGSISDRLAQARETLRKRLNRRGMNLTAALLAVLLLEKTASAGVAPGLVTATVEGAVALASGKIAAAEVSPDVLKLTRDGAEPALSGFLKATALLAMIFLAVGLVSPALGFSERPLWMALRPATGSDSAAGQGSGGSAGSLLDSIRHYFGGSAGACGGGCHSSLPDNQPDK